MKRIKGQWCGKDVRKRTKFSSHRADAWHSNFGVYWDTSVSWQSAWVQMQPRLPIQFPANAHAGRQEIMAQVQGLCQVGDPHGVLGSWLLNGLVLASAAIWGLNQ